MTRASVLFRRFVTTGVYEIRGSFFLVGARAH